MDKITNIAVLKRKLKKIKKKKNWLMSWGI